MLCRRSAGGRESMSENRPSLGVVAGASVKKGAESWMEKGLWREGQRNQQGNVEKS